MDKFLAQFSKNTLAVVAIAGGIFFIILSQPPRTVCDTQMDTIKSNQKLFLFKEQPKKGVQDRNRCFRRKKSLLPFKVDGQYDGPVDDIHLACIPMDNGYYALTDIKTKKQIGRPYSSLSACGEEEYTCTKYQSLHDRCKRTNDPGGCYELFSGIRGLLTDLDTLTRDCSAAAGTVEEVQKAMWDSMDLLVRLAWGDKPPSAYHAKFGWLDKADISLFCKLKGRLQNTYGEVRWNKYRDEMMVNLPGAAELPRNQVWDMSIFSENCALYP